MPKAKAGKQANKLAKAMPQKEPAWQYDPELKPRLVEKLLSAISFVEELDCSNAAVAQTLRGLAKCVEPWLPDLVKHCKDPDMVSPEGEVAGALLLMAGVWSDDKDKKKREAAEAALESLPVTRPRRAIKAPKRFDEEDATLTRKPSTAPDEEAMGAVASHHQEALDNPSKPVETKPVTSAAEKTHLVVDFEVPAAAYPPKAPELHTKAAQKRPAVGTQERHAPKKKQRTSAGRTAPVAAVTLPALKADAKVPADDKYNSAAAAEDAAHLASNTQMPVLPQHTFNPNAVPFFMPWPGAMNAPMQQMPVANARYMQQQFLLQHQQYQQHQLQMHLQQQAARAANSDCENGRPPKFHGASLSSDSHDSESVPDRSAALLAVPRTAQTTEELRRWLEEFGRVRSQSPPDPTAHDDASNRNSYAGACAGLPPL